MVGVAVLGNVGEAVGNLVSTIVGTIVGTLDGAVVLMKEGAAVGILVGEATGATVGVEGFVGVAVAEGFVGRPDGTPDIVLGLLLGDAVAITPGTVSQSESDSSQPTPFHTNKSPSLHNGLI